jgi:HK97 family phage portal protein
MSAMAANPWVFVAVQAIANDLAGLPLVAEFGPEDRRQQTTNHWLVRLLRKPHPKISGRKLRRQLYADWRIAGNAYVRVWRASSGRPIQLGRIPPQLIEPMVSNDGEEVGWRLQSGHMLRWEDVLHIADLSWEASSQVVLGETPIRPLSLGLQVDVDARKQAGRAARRGILEMILSPKDPQVYLGEEGVAAMVASWVKSREEGHGLYIPNAGMEATPTTLTPKDLEWTEARKETKSEILAVMGVPPTRAGDPAANYGTAKEQMRTYWSMLLGVAALFDDEFTRLSDDGIEIRHSFSRVEALQTSFTERQARAVVWSQQFGIPPKDAARYEGFIDAPISEDAVGSNMPSAAPGTDADEPRETLSAVISVLASIRAMYQRGEDTNQVRELTPALLRSALRLLPNGPDDTVVVEASEVLYAVACASLASGDTLELPAFGVEHAKRIVRLVRR